MTAKTPIRTVFDGSNNATGLAEFQSGEFIGLTHGGLGASLTIGSAGQVLKVNSGGTAIEFGNVDDALNIDGATDLTGVTLATTDQLLVSDGGTEGRVTLAQLDTLFTSTTQTLTNKTIDSASNTLTLDLSEGTLTGTTAEFNTALSDGSFATLAGTETLTNKTISGSSNTLSNIGNSSLTNSTITVAGDSGSNAVDLGDTLTVSGTSNEIETSVSGDTITIGLPNDVVVGNDLTVTGNLTVSGTTTTVDTTNTVVSDTLLELGNGTTGTPSNDAGIVIERGDSNNAFMGFDESADKFIVGTGTFTGASTGDLTITTGTLVANLEGDVTGDVTGNADTATALSSAVTVSLTGDVTGSATFTSAGDTASISTTVAANSVALGTDTTGNYVATITAGTGISGASSSEGGTPTIALSHLGIESLTDPNADRIYFWDDSAGATAFLTVGSNLTLSGTTLSADAQSPVAGTGIDVSGTTVSVDVSDFMTNGSNNRVVTATGTDGQNAEANMTFDGSTLDVAGAIRATGDITAFYSSDETLKTDIKTIENPIDKVKEIKGVSYHWTPEAQETYAHFTGHKEIGVIAQDVEKVMPEIVATRPDGTKAVRYERMCALLIECVKDLQNQIDELKK